MVRRRMAIVLLGVFTASVALLLPLFAGKGLNEIPSEGRPNAQRPTQVNETNTEVTELHVTLAVDQDEYQHWLQLNELFMERNPDVRVVLHNERPAEASRWTEQAQLGLTSDIYLMDDGQVIDFAVQGYLRQMDDFYTGDRINEQLKALTESLTWNNSLWGVPVDADPVVFLWHSGLLAQAGLNRPPASWEQFTAAGEKLRTEDPAIMTFSAALQDGRAVAAWLGAFAQEGKTVKELGKLSGQSVQQIMYLAMPHESRTGGSTVEAIAEQFRAGKLLSACMLWTEFLRLPEEVRSSLRVDEREARFVWTGGRSFVVASQSDKQEAALRWLSAMTGPNEEQSRYIATGRLPALKSLYRTQYDLGDVTIRPPFAMLAGLTKAAYAPQPDWWARWKRWSALWRTLGHQALTEAEAERIVQQWNRDT